MPDLLFDPPVSTDSSLTVTEPVAVAGRVVSEKEEAGTFEGDGDEDLEEDLDPDDEAGVTDETVDVSTVDAGGDSIGFTPEVLVDDDAFESELT